MRTLVTRMFSTAVVLWMAVWMVLGAVPALAQGDDPRAQVERVVIDLVRAEHNGDLNRLYDSMAPESREMIPRQAFMLWYVEQGFPLPVDVPTIGDVALAAGTYAMTGDDYDEIAYVEYTVPVEGSDDPDAREMMLVHDGVTWRWLFDASEDDAAAIRDVAGFTVDHESIYSTDIYRQLDTFWAQVFADHGAEYRSPVDMIGVQVFPVETGCGMMERHEFEASLAFYCGLDETIYYDPVFRDWVIEEFGEYAWHQIVAHEWAHHVQDVLGLFTSIDPELYGGSYTIEHELQADCLAAVFTQDVAARGQIGNRDVRRAADITRFVGDPQGTTWDMPDAHGDGDQRVESFWLGFDNGLRGCYVTIATPDR